MLSGTEFQLSIESLRVNFTGAARIATAVNGQVPAPLLRWREGETVTVRVTNRLPQRSSIHWHGLRVPANMDGVPGLSFSGIAPGDTYTYRFPVRQSGTYWYHAHSGLQEQTGLHGPLVIEPSGGEPRPTDRDYVVFLADWTDSSPEHIYATLKRQSDYFNVGRRTLGDFFADARAKGWKSAASDWGMWGQMRMSPTDLMDVSGYTYTYLMNGSTPAANSTALFNPGESVRLRFINGSSMSFFDIRIPGLDLTVVAADGQDIEPVTVEEFRIGTAETYDVIVRPNGDDAYTIFAQSMDRSGYARGTLAPRAGMSSQNKNAPVHHAPAESGPGVDMLVAAPQPALDDPGIGVRNKDAARMAGDFTGLWDPDLQRLAWRSLAGISQVIQVIGLLVIVVAIGRRTGIGAARAGVGGVIAIAAFLLTGHTSGIGCALSWRRCWRCTCSSWRSGLARSSHWHW